MRKILFIAPDKINRITKNDLIQALKKALSFPDSAGGLSLSLWECALH